MGNQIKVHLKTLKRKNGLKNVRYQKQHNYRKATFLFEKTNVKSHRVLATNKSLKALLRAANAKLMALGVSAMYSEQFIESLPELISHRMEYRHRRSMNFNISNMLDKECIKFLFKTIPSLDEFYVQKHSVPSDVLQRFQERKSFSFYQHHHIIPKILIKNGSQFHDIKKFNFTYKNSYTMLILPHLHKVITFQFPCDKNSLDKLSNMYKNKSIEFMFCTLKHQI